jgi:Zn-dependent M28 family amino/carboxypeptidase
MIVGAHYDTQYNSPGAGDNASGISCLLSMAKYFKEKKTRRSIIFAAYGAEEIGCIGSQYHVENLKAQNKLQDIRIMLNLDMLSCNKPNWIHVSEDFLAQETIRRAIKERGIEDKYGWVEIVTPPRPTGDHDPFYDEKIPCINLTWKGYKYPFTHTSDDTTDKIDADVFMDSFQLACTIIEKADGLLGQD